jgi:hypothetical protein
MIQVRCVVIRHIPYVVCVDHPLQLRLEEFHVSWSLRCIVDAVLYIVQIGDASLCFSSGSGVYLCKIFDILRILQPPRIYEMMSG